jgi:hypothetical protein
MKALKLISATSALLAALLAGPGVMATERPLDVGGATVVRDISMIDFAAVRIRAGARARPIRVGRPVGVNRPNRVGRPIGVNRPIGVGRPIGINRPALPNRPGNIGGFRPGGRPPVVIVRPWRPRPHYGAFVAGVALGALVTTAVAGSVPAEPAPNLCWYWADSTMVEGYWDYCS